MNGTDLVRATFMYKINASATARMRGRRVLNGTTEIRGSAGEKIHTMMRPTAGDTVELQRCVRAADGNFAAEHAFFRGLQIRLPEALEGALPTIGRRCSDARARVRGSSDADT